MDLNSILLPTSALMNARVFGFDDTQFEFKPRYGRAPDDDTTLAEWWPLIPHNGSRQYILWKVFNLGDLLMKRAGQRAADSLPLFNKEHPGARWLGLVLYTVFCEWENPAFETIVDPLYSAAVASMVDLVGGAGTDLGDGSVLVDYPETPGFLAGADILDTVGNLGGLRTGAVPDKYWSGFTILTDEDLDAVLEDAWNQGLLPRKSP